MIQIDDVQSWLEGKLVPSYADIINKWGTEFINYRLRWELEVNTDIKKECDLHKYRRDYIDRFGFSIPCAELLDTLKSLEPIIEIGAGSGYLTSLTRSYGIKIIGADPSKETHWFTPGLYDPYQLNLEGKTAVRRFSDYNVFCSWPSLNQTWFRQALKAMKIGQKLTVIREDCCAEETAWSYLNHCFEMESSILIPTWPFIYDTVEVWRKVRQKARL